jgi:HEXXH motif-containing protein
MLIVTSRQEILAKEPSRQVAKFNSGLIHDQGKPLRAMFSSEGTILTNIQKLLEWREAAEMLEPLQKWYWEIVRREVGNTFDEIHRQDPPTGEWLCACLERLPDWAANRFLAAPETRRHISKLRHHPKEHILFFRSALLAEQTLAGNDANCEACWSALGDFYFSGPVTVDPCFDRWKPDLTFVAPRVHGLIPVDFCSPHAQVVNSMPDCPYDPYQPKEVAELGALLDRALVLIELVSPTAASLIHRFVQVIVPRRDVLNPQTAFGSSTPSHVGRLLLRNCHLMEIGQMVDSLVHEAIHAILFVVEVSEPFLVDAQVDQQPRLCSPWSGRLLPLHAYLHACFVWYGLAQFWREVMRLGVLPPPVIDYFLNAALRGFRAGNPSEALVPHAVQIDSRVMKCVSGICTRLSAGAALV